MQANRVFPAAAVLATGVCAGTIESSSGSAIVTPMPRSRVRRERCFFEIYILVSFDTESLLERPVLQLFASGPGLAARVLTTYQPLPVKAGWRTNPHSNRILPMCHRIRRYRIRILSP